MEAIDDVPTLLDEVRIQSTIGLREVGAHDECPFELFEASVSGFKRCEGEIGDGIWGKELRCGINQSRDNTGLGMDIQSIADRVLLRAEDAVHHAAHEVAAERVVSLERVVPAPYGQRTGRA